MNTDQKLTNKNIAMVLCSTILYWLWESQAEGNIRIDLVLFYPVLFAIYTGAFWQRYKFYSLLYSAAIMALNIIFFIYSYDLFGKSTG